MTRFVTEIVRELNKISEVELFLLVTNIDQTVTFPENKYIISNWPTSPLEFFQSLRLNKYGFDAVFSPHYFFGGAFRKFILIRTVFDLIAFRYPYIGSSLQWKLFYSTKCFLKRFIHHSDGIATISETVKKQIEEISDRPIGMIGCASMSFEVQNRGNTKNLLYIGRYESYKNIEVLIHAMDGLEDYTLLLAGNCSEQRKSILLKDSRSKDRILFLGRIDDGEYFRLLESCFALVMPSKDEGFGLPVIEAMNAGCPVICSDTPIFREVAGDAALFFALDNPHELAKQIRALEAPDLRQTMGEKASFNLKRFSWKTCANELIRFIHKLLEKPAL